jgi:hypothetical protein
MKYILVVIFFTPILIFAQGNCSCSKNISLKPNIDCDTTFLKNGAILFYQFNCDSVWLTFKNGDKSKVICSIESDLMDYSYRLGYQLIREFNHTLLFRYGCPATGPCDHILIDKETGKELKKFNNLIYKAEDPFAEFIVYFSDKNYNSLTIDFLDKNKTYKIVIDSNHFNSIYPENQFDTAALVNNKLILSYMYHKNENDSELSKEKIIIDLDKYDR